MTWDFLRALVRLLTYVYNLVITFWYQITSLGINPFPLWTLWKAPSFVNWGPRTVRFPGIVGLCFYDFRHLSGISLLPSLRRWWTPTSIWRGLPSKTRNPVQDYLWWVWQKSRRRCLWEVIELKTLKIKAIGLDFCAGLEISEFSLESLLRPPFLRSVSRIIFDLMKQETTLVN